MQAEKPDEACVFKRLPKSVIGKTLMNDISKELRFMNLYDPNCVKTFSPPEKQILTYVDEIFN